ncbi:sulfite exporter TauE/SafE family protein [Teredinibacter waterburyi]|uniref:sulfite exporter TauE/SafE family protein n=1 Tax=Teredinibacter waterburyi TaxID=1500538 RepID=UPI001FEAB482|nr:sulfite exporter TauE/SafE family protein [Teredinibacter waterburyi]
MIADWLPLILLLLVSGACAGFLAGLLGVGGGIVTVPVLYLIFPLSGVSASSAMLIATGTSLLVIVPTSISSIIMHHRQGNIDPAIVKLWWPFVLLGVSLGVVLSNYLGGDLVSLVFALLALWAAFNLSFSPATPKPSSALPTKSWQALAAAVIGAFSAAMGIGGGTLSVPLLRMWNIPTHRAIGSAAAVGLLIALPGALMMLLYSPTPLDAPPATIGFVCLPAFLVIAPMSILCAPLGVKLGSYLNGVTLQRFFAGFLCVVALRMLYQSLIF